jgi:hypothetical protein
MAIDHEITASDFDGPSAETLQDFETVLQDTVGFIEAQADGKVSTAASLDGTTSTHRFIVKPRRADSQGVCSFSASIIDTLKGEELLERDINIAVSSNDRRFHYLQEPGEKPMLSVIDRVTGMPDSRQSLAARIIGDLNDARAANERGVNNVTEGTLREFNAAARDAMARLS